MAKVSKKLDEFADVYRRLEALENQTRRMNTLDVYVKKVMEMEERLGQVVIDKDSGAKRKKAGSSKSGTNDLIMKLVPLFEEIVKAEFKPVKGAIEDLYKRMSKVENKIFALEKWMTEAMDSVESGKGKKKGNGLDHQVIFQELKVDTLFIDKYEQLNNIGSLGVKELSGQMNIGATLENSSNPGASEEMSDEVKEKWNQKMKKFKEMKEKYGIDQNDHQDRDEVSKNEEVNASVSDVNQGKQP